MNPWERITSSGGNQFARLSCPKILGKKVDTDALVAELNSGRITAALDVTDPEPLPAGHPLWSAKGVFITPHIGGNSSAFEPRARKLIESQLQLLAAGKPLDNVII